jgi:hypothetical protein
MIRNRREISSHWRAVASAVFLFAACDPPQNTQGDAASAPPTPLPERFHDPWTQEKRDRMIRNAREDVVKIGVRVGGRMEDSIVSLGQSIVALHALAEEQVFAQSPPTVILAYTTPVPGGKRSLVIDWLNPNRETTRVIVLLRGADREVVEMEINIPLTEKSVAYVAGRDWPMRQLSWSEFVSLADTESDGRRKLKLVEGKTIPYPYDDSVLDCIAVQDRLGMMSSFVPVGRPEFRDALEEAIKNDLRERSAND